MAPAAPGLQDRVTLAPEGANCASSGPAEAEPAHCKEDCGRDQYPVAADLSSSAACLPAAAPGGSTRSAHPGRNYNLNEGIQRTPCTRTQGTRTAEAAACQVAEASRSSSSTSGVCNAPCRTDSAGFAKKEPRPTDDAVKPRTRRDKAAVLSGAQAAPSAACALPGDTVKGEGQQGEPLDAASLFLSPSEDLDSWSLDGRDLLLPASSFVSADAISQHGGPMSLEQHDRQCSGMQTHQPPHQAGNQVPGVALGEPSMRRRRLQRESVATTKGRRSVRHAFLLDRTGGARGAAAGPVGTATGFSPGANDDWGDADEEPAPCVSVREDLPGEVAGEQALDAPSMGAAVSVQRQLLQGPRTIGYEPHFTRFIGGSIDRRWALQQRALRIPAEAFKGELAHGKEEPLDLRLEEFGAATAPKMWPKIGKLPERIFVGLPIQVAYWVSWGRAEGPESGRMLWRDCEVVQLLPGGSFKAKCFSAEDHWVTCNVRDFVPPRVPAPSPQECAWRLVPVEADSSRDIYPGACLSVGLNMKVSAQDLQHAEAARAYFVDVVVQDIYFSLEQITRAKQELAEARERDETGRGRSANGSRRVTGCTGSGGPLAGLRPNCPVRAMRVMVLRGDGASSEFAVVSGRIIYKLGYDLHTHAGILKETAAKHRHGACRRVWAIPRALISPTAEQLRGISGASLSSGSVEANAKRWQYKTQEDSREWINFPPFLVAYVPYDFAARFPETHPILLRYLQPELDLAALSRGIWRICLAQYEYPHAPPALLPHPSDMPQQESLAQGSGEVADAPAEGVTTLGSPYSHSGGAPVAGPESRCAVAGDDIMDSLYATQACEPPQPVGTTQSAAESAAPSSVLGINHLASLLCSGGDSAPPNELLSRALPFFRGLLPHVRENPVTADWQLEVARAALRAADQAKELYVEEQETEVEKLRRQGISFGGFLEGSTTAESGRHQRGAERPGGAEGAEMGDAWDWLGSSGSRYPTSSDISRFLLRTSGHGVVGGPAKGHGAEANISQNEALGHRRRPADLVGSMSADSRRESFSEFGAPEAYNRDGETTFFSKGATGAEEEFPPTRRFAASGSTRVVTEEVLSTSRARSGLCSGVLAGTFGASQVTGRRRPVLQREEEEDFLPPARTAMGSRQIGAGGRAGIARRAARNVSYTALAGVEPPQEELAFYRPVKRLARGDPPSCNANTSAADSWDHAHLRDAGRDAAGGDRHLRGSIQQWPALQRQAGAADDRIPSVQGNRSLAETAADGSISADQLHEALKGFVQSIKAGASPAVVNVPAMSRDRSFAASH